MSKKIGAYSEEHLLNVAKDVVGKKTNGTKLLDAEAEGRIPKFDQKGKGMDTHLFSCSAAVSFSDTIYLLAADRCWF
jgi:hypothetical protein